MYFPRSMTRIQIQLSIRNSLRFLYEVILFTYSRRLIDEIVSTYMTCNIFLLKSKKTDAIPI